MDERSYLITALHDDHGSIIRFHGVDTETGNEVIIAAEHRPAQTIIDALHYDDEPVIVAAPSWAVTHLASA